MPNTIPSEFVDVDVAVGPGYDPAVCAAPCTPRTDQYGENFRTFADSSIQEIPRSRWRDTIGQLQGRTIDRLIEHILNQLREGTCTANAAAQGIQILIKLACGLWIPISPISLYWACGRSPNSGSSVTCIARRLSNVGGLPVNTPENRAWMESVGMDPSHTLEATGFYQSKPPSGWEATAENFRLVETFDINTFEEFASCLLQGIPVHYGRSGHSILGVELVYDGGKYYVKYANSWGPDWGDDGRGYDSEDYLRGAIRSYGAIGYRTAKTQPWMEGDQAGGTIPANVVDGVLTSHQPPKRKRGRPKGSKNRKK